jgi:myo-inositol-1(or 4)-monophosphatase
MDDAKLREIHDSLIQIAFESGEKILAATPTTEHAGSKKNCEIISLPSIILAIS